LPIIFIVPYELKLKENASDFLYSNKAVIANLINSLLDGESHPDWGFVSK